MTEYFYSLKKRRCKLTILATKPTHADTNYTDKKGKTVLQIRVQVIKCEAGLVGSKGDTSQNVRQCDTQYLSNNNTAGEREGDGHDTLQVMSC